MKLLILKLNLVIILLVFESFVKADIIHKGIQNSEVLEIKENHTRKLSNDDGGYMIVYYISNATYSDGFQKDYRKNISYIINGDDNTHIAANAPLNIMAGTQIEIHFIIPPENLNNFFHSNYDGQVSKIGSIDLSNLDTSSVTNMGNMLNDCSSLKSINLSHLNTSSVKDMNKLFYGSYSL